MPASPPSGGDAVIVPIRDSAGSAGLGAGQYEITVHADATHDAGVTHIEPSTVQIRITSVK